MRATTLPSLPIVFFVSAVMVLALPAGEAFAISVGAFGPNGEGGTVNGQTFTVGGGGEAFEIDGFVNVSGQDLNGADLGTSAQLSADPLPTGLDYAFASELSIDTTDITLSYSFTNNTSADLMGVTFLSFVDFEIDEPVNTFYNETATASGTLAAGRGFEADEPGYAFGDIFDNLRLGTLDDTNVFPPADDVSMALSFDFDLAVGETTTIDILISEDGDAMGSFFLTQSDQDPASTTTITYSGEIRPRDDGPVAGIPEPGAATLFAAGAVLIGGAVGRRRRGT